VSGRLLRVRRRLWGAAESALYARKNYDMVEYEPYGHGDTPISLAFLRDLAGLTGVRLPIDSEITDDSDVFCLAGLTDLHLEHGATNPLAFGPAAASLRRITTYWRPGVETLAAATSVEDLVVLQWKAGDLGFARQLRKLRRLEISVRARGVLSCRGLRELPELAEVQLRGGRVSELGELPPSITRLDLTRVKDLTLEFVAALPRLEHLTVQACGSVPSIAPLAGHPALNGVDLTGTRTSDGCGGEVLPGVAVWT
jgi:hypothetical protein